MKIILVHYAPAGISHFAICSGPITMHFEMETDTGRLASVMPVIEPYATKAVTEARLILSQRNRSNPNL